MSSMRNAVQRRNHKERAQPLSREKLGILEKHKDYSLRAKDYNEKKRRLKLLRHKAAERNPDEFHFGMMSSRTDQKGRKLADRGNQSLSHEAVKLYKTQDAGYLRTMATKTKHEIQRLEQSMLFEDVDGKDVKVVKVAGIDTQRDRIIFVDDLNTQQHRIGKLSKRTPLEDEINSSNELQSGPGKKSTLKRQRKRLLAWREAKLDALRTRERDLSAAEGALQLERARMNNDIGGVTKAGWKFKVRDRKT